jgi:hypothetical protein
MPAGSIVSLNDGLRIAMNSKRQEMAAVVAEAAPYWAGEAEVVRTYFHRPRTQTQDLFWLRAQAYKEARPFRDLPKERQEEFLHTGTVRTSLHGPDTVQRIAQETGHFRLLADLIADCFGVTVNLTDEVLLPQDRKLQELRAAFRAQGGKLEQAAVAFTEGGGGAMFQVLSHIEGGELEHKIAAVFTVIAREEIPHGPMEIHALARHADSEKDWKRARTVVRIISRQRLLMRNEMFGFPLDSARIHEIDEGRIQPWPLPIAL